MKKVLNMLTVLLLAVAAASCDRDRPGDEFLESEDPCLIVDGRTVHRFDPLGWQLGYNAARKEFRVHNDSRSDYYILECDHIPTERGETVTGDLKWSGSSMMYRRNLTFEVMKTDAQGRIWLWSRKNRIAVSVMALK